MSGKADWRPTGELGEEGADGTKSYLPAPGESITDVAGLLVSFARASCKPARAIFNDIEIVANPGDEAAAIVASYHHECDTRRQTWEASPEGQEVLRECQEAQRRAAEAMREPLREFGLIDAESWHHHVEVNSDPYGSGVVRFAARWASMMEARIADGAELAAIAKEASHEADTEGISGFMYGAAVSILSTVWEHGEALRRWHNLDMQIHDEGEKANEAGTVLNPALLTIQC